MLGRNAINKPNYK